MTGDSSTISIYRVGKIEIPANISRGEGPHPTECYSIPIQIPLLICRRPIITFDTPPLTICFSFSLLKCRRELLCFEVFWGSHLYFSHWGDTCAFMHSALCGWWAFQPSSIKITEMESQKCAELSEEHIELDFLTFLHFTIAENLKAQFTPYSNFTHSLARPEVECGFLHEEERKSHLLAFMCCHPSVRKTWPCNLSPGWTYVTLHFCCIYFPLVPLATIGLQWTCCKVRQEEIRQTTSMFEWDKLWKCNRPFNFCTICKAVRRCTCRLTWNFSTRPSKQTITRFYWMLEWKYTFHQSSDAQMDCVLKGRGDYIFLITCRLKRQTDNVKISWIAFPLLSVSSAFNFSMCILQKYFKQWHITCLN